MSTSSASLAIVGDGSVGKSSITEAFKSDGFQKVYKQTMGIDFYEKKIEVRGRMISLKVWDIGGQSIHSKSLVQYLSGAQGILLVYDTTNIDSFNNLEDWLNRVRQYSSSKPLSIYLVGNKIDLIHLRQVPATLHDKFISENELQGGLYLSAKTGENVVKLFHQCAAEVTGIGPLSAYELASYDKVLKAHIVAKSADGEGEGEGEGEGDESRTPWADEIEALDREAERKKLEREAAGEAMGCQCVIW